MAVQKSNMHLLNKIFIHKTLKSLRSYSTAEGQQRVNVPLPPDSNPHQTYVDPKQTLLVQAPTSGRFGTTATGGVPAPPPSI
jgi:hypothetical protein